MYSWVSKLIITFCIQMYKKNHLRYPLINCNVCLAHYCNGYTHTFCAEVMFDRDGSLMVAFHVTVCFYSHDLY